MPEVPLTVAVLTRNRKAYLREALEAIRTQAYPDMRIKVLDNASTDGTDDVVAAFLSDRRFEYVRHAQDIGAAGNYNHALNSCTTEFLLITHDDDRMKPEMLARELSVLHDHSDVNLVCCDTDQIDGSGKLLHRSVFGRSFGLGGLFFQGRYEFIKGYAEGINYISCPTVMLRMASVRAGCLMFRSDVGPALDTLFWMDLNCLPGRFAFIGESLYEYRIHRAQDSLQNSLIIYSYLKKAVWDVLERENLTETTKTWKRRIDREITAVLLSRAKARGQVDGETFRSVRSMILSRGGANIRHRWVLFWLARFPGIFAVTRLFRVLSSLFLRVFQRATKSGMQAPGTE